MPNYQPTQRLTEIDKPTNEWKDEIRVDLPANERGDVTSNTVVSSQRRIIVTVSSAPGTPAKTHQFDEQYIRQSGEETVKVRVVKNGGTEGEDEESYPD